MLSFVLNARFNFCVSDKIVQRMVCFFGVALLGWSISALLLYAMVTVWNGFNKYLSKAATLVVVVILQYNLNRLLSFRKSN